MQIMPHGTNIHVTMEVPCNYNTECAKNTDTERD